jgi:hypothetical protein
MLLDDESLPKLCAQADFLVAVFDGLEDRLV